MIRELIKLVYTKKPMFPPSWRMMICIPSSITEVEKELFVTVLNKLAQKKFILFMSLWPLRWELVLM
jgi:actin-like ATPase involved in cell morphogenesis